MKTNLINLMKKSPSWLPIYTLLVEAVFLIDTIIILWIWNHVLPHFFTINSITWWGAALVNLGLEIVATLILFSFPKFAKKVYSSDIFKRYQD